MSASVLLSPTTCRCPTSCLTPRTAWDRPIPVEIGGPDRGGRIINAGPRYGQRCRSNARAGIPEYWIVDVNDRVVHQLWSRRGDGYDHTPQTPFGARVTAETIEGLPSIRRLSSPAPNSGTPPPAARGRTPRRPVLSIARIAGVRAARADPPALPRQAIRLATTSTAQSGSPTNAHPYRSGRAWRIAHASSAGEAVAQRAQDFAVGHRRPSRAAATSTRGPRHVGDAARPVRCFETIRQQPAAKGIPRRLAARHQRVSFL